MQDYLYSMSNNIIEFDYIWYVNLFLESLTFESFLKLILIYFFIVWIAIVIWVTKDIINRTNNILLQIFSILTVLLFTPLGIFIYLLIRPSKTLFEQYYEETELEEDDVYNLSESLKDSGENKMSNKKEKTISCFKCSYKLSDFFKFCPNCWEALKKDCKSCKKELKTEWKVCPFCWKDQENRVEEILKIDNPKKKDINNTTKKGTKEKNENS